VFEFGRGGLNQIYKKALSVGTGDVVSEFGAVLYCRIITAFVRAQVAVVVVNCMLVLFHR
jgi:hypothetical protein